MKKLLFIFICTILLLFLFLLIRLNILGGNAPKQQNSIPRGVGVNLHGDISDQDILNLKQLGVGWVRLDLRWDTIEKEKGNYNFKLYDSITERLTKNNIKPFFILNYSNYLYEKEQSILTEEGGEAFASYVKAATDRYKDKGIIWEIWNEPNTEKFWNSQPSYYQYGLLVEKVVPIIKKYDPSGIVVAPALSGTSDDSLIWLENFLKNEKIITSLDAVSVHPYRDSVPETASVSYEKVRKILDKYTNKKIPIINSEWGYSVGAEADGIFITEDEQAKFVIRSILVDKYNRIPISMLYVWKNTGQDPTVKEQNFGLRDYNNVPKAVYYALMNFHEVLNGFTLERTIDTSNDGDYIFVFFNEKEKKKVIVSWTTGRPHVVTIPLSKGSGILKDLYGLYGGNEQNIKWKSDELSMSLTHSPQYLIINQ